MDLLVDTECASGATACADVRTISRGQDTWCVVRGAGEELPGKVGAFITDPLRGKNLTCLRKPTSRNQVNLSLLCWALAIGRTAMM